MKPKSKIRSSLLLALGAATLAISSASAQTNYFWDQNGATANTGGSGAWNTTDNFWRSGSDTGTLGAWVNAGAAPFNTATFAGTAGTVTLTSAITAGGLTFNTNGYTVTGNTLALAGGSTPIINIGNSSYTATISGIVAGTNGLEKTGAGTLTLSAVTPTPAAQRSMLAR